MSARSPFTDRVRAWAKTWARRFGDDAGQQGFFPWVGTVVSGSGLAAGGGYRDYHLAGAFGFDAAALVSYRRYQLYRARVGLLDRRRDTLTLAPADGVLPSILHSGTNTAPGFGAYGEVTYRQYPEHAFYASGPESPGDDRADYALSGGSYDLVVQAQLSRHLAISSRVGLFAPTVSTAEGGRFSDVETAFDQAGGARLGRQPRFVTFGVGAALDHRNDVERPAAGAYLGLAAWRYASRGGAFDFSRWTLDARHYAAPFSARGVLAVRLIVSSSVPAAGSRVPFYLQYTLGGNDALRGFTRFRFRDNSLAYLAAEYRWALNRFVDVIPFVEGAGMGPTLRATARSRVESSAGVGALLKRGGRSFLRVDWARSREGNRVAVGTGVLF